MLEPTGSLRDAASTIFNLPDYRVVDAVHLPAGGRMVVVECTAPPGCPAFGVVAVRMHSRRRQVVRDVPVGGPVQVVETDKLWSITCTWWPAIEVLIVTGVTNARTEAAITTNRDTPIEIRQAARTAQGGRMTSRISG